jgi:hypothetical protein
MTDYHAQYIARQLDYIVGEAEATRHGPNRWYSLDEAVAILITDRVDRHILSATEADSVRLLWQGRQSRERK